MRSNFLVGGAILQINVLFCAWAMSQFIPAVGPICVHDACEVMRHRWLVSGEGRTEGIVDGGPGRVGRVGAARRHPMSMAIFICGFNRWETRIQIAVVSKLKYCIREFTAVTTPTPLLRYSTSPTKELKCLHHPMQSYAHSFIHCVSSKQP